MPHDNTKPLKSFWWLAAILSTFAGVLSLWVPETFARFFGPVHPLVVCAVAYAVGGISLLILTSRFGFSFLDMSRQGRGVMIAGGAAAVIGGVIITIDIIAPFPQDLNVLFPISVLFYPVVALIVESLFHLAPLCFLYLLRDWLGGGFENQKDVPLFIGAVALLEPLFQFFLMTSTGGLSAIAFVVFGHVLAINLTQLYLFVRFDFVSMFCLRIFYYLIWHVIWGYVRLQ